MWSWLCVEGKILSTTQDLQDDRGTVVVGERGSDFVFETGQFISLASANSKVADVVRWFQVAVDEVLIVRDHRRSSAID